MNNLSVLMITKNPDLIIDKSIRSIKDIAAEIVIIDDSTNQNKIELVQSYKPFIYSHKEKDLGRKKAYGLKKCNKEWVLCLDSDEIVTSKLATEIQRNLSKKISKVSGFIIPYQNYFLGKPINYGGENYKMLRLFRRKNAVIKSSFVHESFRVKTGEIRELNNKILHFSYRSLTQMYRKFTDYSFREYIRRSKRGEKSSLKKIFLYPIHMFYARFIKDKGYKDGLFRIPLDLGFAYMEFLTYFLLFFKPKRK